MLGVTPSASTSEIRAAYIARTRVIHPDRFDPKTQQQDWLQANAMLAELNEAFAVLRDAERRRQYDARRSARRPETSSAPPPPPAPPSPEAEPVVPPSYPEELTAGHARYEDLPRHARERLVQRQTGGDKNQIRIRLASVAWIYAGAMLGSSWVIVIFASVGDVRWSEGTLLLYWGITAVAACFTGWNVIKALRWHSSAITPYFYVTPLYFIKRGYDTVSFWPIWAVTDRKVTHRLQNGAYQDSEVVLVFGTAEERLSFSSEAAVDDFFSKVRQYYTDLRAAWTHQQYDYFRLHDDFFGTARSTAHVRDRVKTNRAALVYAATTAAFVVALTTATALNTRRADSWAQQVRGPSAQKMSEQRSPETVPPMRDTPAPQAESPPKPSRPATSNERSKTRSVPNAKEASRDRARPLPREQGPSVQPLEYVDVPNGFVFHTELTEGNGRLRIVNGAQVHAVAKLGDPSQQKSIHTVLIRSGNETTVAKIPDGTYRLLFALGKGWSEERQKFKESRGAQEFEKNATFTTTERQDGDTIYRYSSVMRVTLHPVVGGNAKTAGISEAEFAKY